MVKRKKSSVIRAMTGQEVLLTCFTLLPSEALRAHTRVGRDAGAAVQTETIAQG